MAEVGEPGKEAKGKKAERPPPPEWVTTRLDAFKALADRTPQVDPVEITLVLADGREVKGVAGVTRPAEILKEHLPDVQAFGVLFEGAGWDLGRPLVGSGSLKFFDFESKEGKALFWHSSAHVLGQAVELELGAQLAIGPATENGFFYDFEAPEGAARLDPAALGRIEQACRELSGRADYERKAITREEALELFKINPFKQAILTRAVQPGDLVTVYRSGEFIDLCRGPHVASGRMFKGWWLIDTSQALFDGDQSRPVTRIRGITFPTKDQVQKHKEFIKEAQRRDHRRVGLEHELFFFHPLSPGSAFFYPDGAHIYNKLVEMIRDQYRHRGFVEVISPNLFNEDLFHQSGHWEHYRADMFHFPLDEDACPQPAEGASCAEGVHGKEVAMKPMNCPGHCLIFGNKERSYRELPLRFAEFGVLHRNEATGALSGLSRTRRFVQDDCHIFARVDQIGSEMEMCIDFVNTVYGMFGMELNFTLSTINMDKYMGDLDVWAAATQRLRDVLTAAQCKFVEAPGEAAFYGPKIDILIKDCLGRFFQLATIQLDFQLPEKFDLKYIDAECKAQRPVMIHRAVLGSLERFIGIATEHFDGRFPFWLSPHQICVTPLKPKDEPQLARCAEIAKILFAEGFAVEVDDSSDHLEKRIVKHREFKLGHAVVVIGPAELKNGTVSVRWWNTPKSAKIAEQSLESFLAEAREKVAKKIRE